jgi:outer membrane phospholipase A
MHTKWAIYYSILFSLTVPLTSQAADKWLIATQTEAFNTGQKITVEAVKPASLAAWPDKLHLKLSGSGLSEEVELVAAAKQPDDVRHIYTGVPKQKFVGVVRTELSDQVSNRLVVIASSDDEISHLEVAATTQGSNPEKPQEAGLPKVVIAQPGEEPPLSANEPIYFIVGSNAERDFDARFQISFKYRPFDPDSAMAQYAPFLSNMYFAYTQTTIWDIGSDSSPFKDTSYRPSLYYKWATSGRGLMPDEWKAGLEHESNGQAGLDSRSLNTGFIRPIWNIDLANGKRLTLQPKFYDYIEKKDNPDIQKYRGYVDWQARYGREDGLILAGLYRQGTGGYASGQLDLSYPISDKIFARTGTFLHLQLLSGYGETLLEYNQDHDTQLRIGLSVAR